MEEAREKPAEFVAALAKGIAILAALGSAVAVSFEDVLYGLATVFLVTAAMSRYLFATTYTLGDSGFTVTHLLWSRHRRWDDFRRADVHSDGVFLSPSPVRSRLDSFRGMFLPTGTSGADITAAVTRHVH